MSEALNTQYYELLGWKSEHIGGGFAALGWRLSNSGERRSELPRLHEDVNLCIAEADRVFDSDWWLTRRPKEFQFVSRTLVELDVRPTGETANEAILKALIAASKARDGEARGE